jgi:hypothetical protein
LRIPYPRNWSPFVKDYKPYTGSQWCMLNKKAMKILMESDLKNQLMTFYIEKVNSYYPKTIISPDEVVFQTFFGNNKLLKNECKNYRYINWENVTDWHPNTLTLEYFDDIKNSDALFARKFDQSKSKELLDRIEKELLIPKQ